MLLNRQTFRLMRLIVLLMLASITPAVMAAPGGPTVTIADAGTSATPSTRTAFLLKFTFSHSVTGFAAGDATFRLYDKVGTFLGTSTNITPTPVTNNPREYTASIDVSTQATAVGFRVTVAADVATGNTLANSLGNQTAFKDFDLPPLVAEGSLALSVIRNATQDPATDGDDYVLTLTYKDASDAAATPSTLPTVDHLTFDPSYLQIAVVAGNTIALKTGAGAADGVYDLSIVHPTGAPSVTIGVQPSYIKGVEVVTVPPLEQEPPSVSMRVSGHDLDLREFRLEITFTPGLKSNGDPGDPVTVGRWTETSGKDFLPSIHLKFTDATNVPSLPTDVVDRAVDNSYIAIFTYSLLDELPITITTVDAFETSDDPRTSVMVVAGPGPTPPSDITFSPNQISNQTFVVNTPITPFFLPMATGGTSPYTYTLAPLPAGLVFNAAMQQLSGTPTVVGTTTPTYTATDAANNTATLTFTIEVLAADTPSIIPDTNLAAAIRRSLFLPANTPLTAEVMAQLLDLNAYSSGIVQLDGLEQATNLTTLDLGMNQITNISALSGLSQLTHLYLDDNQITDVSALVGLRNLRLLRLARNPIQDTSPLATLIQQNPGLDLDVPPISPDDGSVTFADSNLETAVRVALRMTDSEMITREAMLGLFFLEAYDRRIASIQGLEHATNMIALDLGKNAIVDISPLSGLTQLQILFLDDNQIVDVSPLAGLTQLDLLFLTGNPISSLAPISHLIGGIQIFRSKAAE